MTEGTAGVAYSRLDGAARSRRISAARRRHRPLPVSALPNALRRRRRGLTQVPWLLALPGLVALFAFHFLPIGFGSYYAFTDWNGLTPRELDRPRGTSARSSHDPTASGALWHTLELAGLLRRARERDRPRRSRSGSTGP